jgi:hypothetical protein
MRRFTEKLSCYLLTAIHIGGSRCPLKFILIKPDSAASPAEIVFFTVMYPDFQVNAATGTYRGNGFTSVLNMSSTERADRITHIYIPSAVLTFLYLILAHGIPLFFLSLKKNSNFSFLLYQLPPPLDHREQREEENCYYTYQPDRVIILIRIRCAHYRFLKTAEDKKRKG